MEYTNKYIERKFGHCVVTWDIENYCISTAGDIEWTISSPPFFIGGVYLSKWQMMLKRSRISTEECSTYFELMLLEHCHNYELVWTECKLYFCGNSEKYELEDFEYIFSANATCGMKLRHYSNAPLHTYHSRFFKLRIEILVQFDNIAETFSGCNDLSIQQLSDDLYTLFQSKEMGNIHFKVGEEYILAHKCILYHRIRSPFYMQMIRNCDLIDLFDNDRYRAWIRVFSFLYTGNMGYAVTEPSLNTYQCAVAFDIHPIILYYTPDHLSLSTATEVEEINVTWTITNFLTRSESYILSPVLDCLSCSSLTFKVFTGGSGERKNIGVLAEVEVKTPTDICFEVFLNSSSKQNFFSRNHKHISGRARFEDRRMITRGTLKGYMQKDSLIIGLKVRFSTGKQNYFTGTSEVICKPYSEQQNYYQLSEDLMSLYKSSLFNDYHINIRTPLKIHKCILYVRCPNLLHFLMHDSSLTYVYLIIYASELNILLQFFYSGKLKDGLSLENVTDLYDFVENVEIPHIKQVLIDYLQNNIHSFDAARVYEFADLKNLENLRVKASRFINDTPDR